MKKTLSIQLRVMLVLGCCLAAATSLFAAGTVATMDFENGNKLYEQGKFPEAAAVYNRMISSGLSSTALYYNLGNAHFKAGQLGKAISAYHRAADLSPRDPDVKANLQFARNKVQGLSLATSRAAAWLNNLSVNEWTGLFFGAFWVCCGLLVIGQLRPAIKLALRPLLWTSSGAGLLLAICVGLSMQINQPEALAVITQSGAAIRNGPFEESPTALTLNDGAEVRVLDRKDDWVQVGVDSRRNGWVKKELLELLP